jgi:hypothetical protein
MAAESNCLLCAVALNIDETVTVIFIQFKDVGHEQDNHLNFGQN